MMNTAKADKEYARLFTATEGMESVMLDPSQSSSNYVSAMSDSPSSLDFHPLAPSLSPDPTYWEYKEEVPSSSDSITTAHDGDLDAENNIQQNVYNLTRTGENSEFIKISVTQPQKEQDSGGSRMSSSYTTYLVITKTNILEYGKGSFHVRRRFNDVVTLADRLAEAYRGYFIPIRPDKSIFESQLMEKQVFIKNRRVCLEVYLRRLACHPVLRKSQELKVFLTSEGKLPLMPSLDVASRMLDGAVKLPRQLLGDGSIIMSPQEATQPAKGGRDLLRLFKELKQSVVNDWSGIRPQMVEEDKQFLEKKEKLLDFERQLSPVAQKADALLKAQHGLSDVFGELGLAFIKVGNLELRIAGSSLHKAHSFHIKKFATSVVKVSRLHRGSNAEAEKHLDQFHEYLGIMQSIHTGFSDRANALLTAQTLLSDLTTMNSKVEKLTAAASKIFGGDKNRTRKIEELKDAIKSAEKACEYAQVQYDQIKENNRTELERIEHDKQKDFISFLNGFIRSQIMYSERLAKEWENVASEHGGSDSKLPESSLASS